MLVSHMRGRIIPLITSHEPPSRARAIGHNRMQEKDQQRIPMSRPTMQERQAIL